MGLMQFLSKFWQNYYIDYSKIYTEGRGTKIVKTTLKKNKSKRN